MTLAHLENATVSPTPTAELIDFINRIDHQNERLDLIETRLKALQNRLDGTDSAEVNTPPPVPCGILPRFNEGLSDISGRINRIDDLVQRLEQLA